MVATRMNRNTLVKFLLVDDMAENLLALEGLLRRDGLEMLTAKSGSEALELLLNNDFALAILDVQMPEMDGFELAELMRWSVRTRHVPIIFLTAGGPDERRRFRGYEAGAVDFLFKPIDPTIMQGKAEVFFDLYCQRREVVQQRDALRSAMEENSRLYNKLLDSNGSLEERVKERTTQLLEANELLQGFTYSIAHDFHQHIRNVNTNAQIVLSDAGVAVGACRANVERIIQVAQLMNQMTEDLLSYTYSRNAKLRKEDVDLTLLGTEIAATLSGSYKSTRFHVANGLAVRGDRTMIRIVMENLLENAFKFSQNAVDPLVELDADAQGFYIRDNGIGFDMQYSEKIFLPFENLMGEGEFSGTGMGLANVKRIVDRHGGSISVISQPGEGATFHFSVDKP